MTSTGKSSGLSWPLLVLIGILILGAVGYGLQSWLRPPAQPDAAVGQTAIETFLAQIQQGKPGEAWDQSSAEFKSIAGRESFVRLVKKSPLLKEPLTFNSLQKVTVQEQPRTEFLYQSTKSGSMVRILLGFEAGEWKVDRLTI